jgi:hypothetical protein
MWNLVLNTVKYIFTDIKDVNVGENEWLAERDAREATEQREAEHDKIMESVPPQPSIFDVPPPPPYQPPEHIEPTPRDIITPYQPTEPAWGSDHADHSDHSQEHSSYDHHDIGGGFDGSSD